MENGCNNKLKYLREFAIVKRFVNFFAEKRSKEKCLQPSNELEVKQIMTQFAILRKYARFAYCI